MNIGIATWDFLLVEVIFKSKRLWKMAYYGLTQSPNGIWFLQKILKNHGMLCHKTPLINGVWFLSLTSCMLVALVSGQFEATCVNTKLQSFCSQLTFRIHSFLVLWDIFWFPKGRFRCFIYHTFYGWFDIGFQWWWQWWWW